MSQSSFEKANDISLIEFLKAVAKGRVIPYFTSKCEKYDADFLQRFLEPGLPRIPFEHMALINRLNVCRFTDGDCEVCKKTNEIAEKDIVAFMKKGDSDCADCLSKAYEIGIEKETLLKTDVPSQTLCAIREILTSRNIDAAFQTNCPRAREALGLFAGAPEVTAVDTVVRGLRVKYTRDIDFESYLELIDGKTTRAIKRVTEKILKDPYSSKYSERLNSKIFEFNREVEEVAKSKAAKFYHAVSDIAVYGGSKFIERQTEGYAQVGKKHLHKASEWIASKIMDLHAKATGKDWTIAQLYRTRWKLEQCKKLEKS